MSNPQNACYKSYRTYLIESLENPTEAIAYLDAVQEDGGPEHISLALSNIAEAMGNKRDSEIENK